MFTRNKLFLVAMCLLAASAVAGAETTIFSGDIYDLVMSDPVAVGAGAGGEDLVAFTVTALNTTGVNANPGTPEETDTFYDPTVVDNDYFGYTGITGKLHQHYAPSLPSYSPKESDVYATAIDSYWMHPEGLVVAAPSETFGVWPSGEPTDAPDPLDEFAETSFGDRMGGLFGKCIGLADVTPEWMFAHLVSQPGEVISFNFFVTGTLGGEHIVASYTVGQGAGARAAAGTNSTGEFGGGDEGIGGFNFTFDQVTTEGIVTSDYTLGAMPGPVDFDLAGDAQLWEIAFTGEFDGQVALTFRYFHETLPSGMDENLLGIYHQLDSGEWELLPIIARDPAAYTITVLTDSFSPFALGQVPEPATLTLLGIGSLALLRRKR
ncbi:hypothetical protein LCGC14_0304170 [marine sediment metagenome]|uniref:Ice-binding protein C-terminal domain-containing protein n=1 Tax=marine sediment metagenome TaxID=412755 RepID=A0A0F9U6Q1_9ZZZZ|nr:PEP-CTERM sorting domain-containing protein [Phycisphaerae bacterium]HDZ44462.1 PEP-CTERM sorting domain-containing protein [Phycisphaerae bacterium]